jgi:putative ABC transport system permease protein
VTALAPAALVLSATPVAELLGQPLARPRFLSLLVAFFAGVGLLLAAVGLYGVMSFVTASRTQEMGIRMSLGAAPMAIGRLVLRRAGIIASQGVALGLTLALVCTRGLRSLLYGVSPLDGTALSAAVIALLVVAAVASLIPALRATRVDPVTALKAE